jgi:hypothetical protein
MPTLSEMMGIKPDTGNTAPPDPAVPDVPVGIKQIFGGIEAFMPDIERITGMNRKEVTMTLLKTGLKGGGIESLIMGLAGKTPAPELKFVRLIKAFAIWIPVALGLVGFILITLVLYAKFMMSVIGGI